MSEEQRPYGEAEPFAAEPIFGDTAPVIAESLAQPDEQPAQTDEPLPTAQPTTQGDALLSCGHCGGALPTPGSNGEWFGPCPSCGAATLLAVFPRALDGAPEGHQGLLRTADDQATCFEHTDRVAEASCEACGRFVCGTCRVDLYDKVYCAPCLERAADNGEIPQLLTELDRGDISALAFFSLPITFAFVIGIISFIAAMDILESFASAFGAAFSTAIPCIPLGLAQLYTWRKRKTLGPNKKSRAGLYVLIAIVVLFVIVLFIVPMISMLIMFATANK